MAEWTLIRLALVAVFVLANSFFVAAEFALISVRESRMEHLQAMGRGGARTVLRLKQNIDEFLPAVQFGVTLAALALGWLGEPVVTQILLRAAAVLHLPARPHVLEPVSVALAFGVITYLEVLLGELVPKSLALQRAERIAVAVAAPMDAFIRITRPAIRLMNYSATLVLRLFRAPLRAEGSVHSPEELKFMATATRRVGLLPPYQEQIIHRAVELSHVTLREIMTPRARMVLLAADLTLEQASARFVEEQHSRIPVCEPFPQSHAADPDRILGVVYSKDVQTLMHFHALTGRSGSASAPSLRLRQIARAVTVVPETKLAVDLLQEFQRDRRQIAIAVDEFGSTTGLVTAEDILEQVVGELDDEFDVQPRALPAGAGTALLEGTTPLRDLATQLGWEFPREAGVETLAGFLLAQLGHIPEPGEQVSFGPRTFTVVSMQGRRIAQVQIGSVPAALEPALP